MSEAPAHPESAPSAAGDLSAYALLITSLVSMGFASEEWVLVAPFILAVGLHPWLGERFPLRLGYLAYLVLAIPFAILSNVHEIEGRSGLDINTPFYITLYMQMYAILRLFRPPPDKDRLPTVLVCTGLAMAGTGPDAPGHGLFVVLVSAYAVGLVFLLRAQMTVRSRDESACWLNRTAVFSAFVLTICATVCGVLLVREYFNDINNAMMRLVFQTPLASAAGFSDTSKLGDVSRLRFETLAQRVAVRAFSTSAPGYLRGNAFLTYSGSTWQVGTKGVEQNLKASQAAAGADAGGRSQEAQVMRCVLPARPAPEEFLPPALWIHPASLYRAHFFLPLQTASVDTVSTLVIRLPGNILKSKFKGTSRGYGVIEDPARVVDPPLEENSGMPVANAEMVSEVYRTPPPGQALQKRLAEVWEVIRKETGFDPARGGIEGAVRAIKHYFQTHYTYKIGIRFASDEVMLEWLDNARHRTGHCELFASAGTLLLRQLGYPARYVTGFVCKEKNPYSDLWIARQKHAHAWVEYFAPETGWQMAEFTPDNGLPQFESASGFEAFLEYLRGLWEKTTGLVLREGFSGLLALLGRLGLWLIATWPRRIAVALAILAFFVWRFWLRRARRRVRVRVPRVFPEDIARQREEFLALEKALARQGLGRLGSETLTEYAERLGGRDFPDRERILAFIQRYAGLRYAPFAEAR